MAFVYVCDPCLNENHDQCENCKDKPPEGMCGGGVCICNHVTNVYTPLERVARDSAIEINAIRGGSL